MFKKNKEDYLRAIYHIFEKNKTDINSIDVANYLGYSKAAISKMFKKLTQEHLLKREPYSKITFTKKGLKIAQELTYKHRIIEVFLFKILKIKKSLIHEEAHNLEHAFSNQSIKKLALFLKNPKFAPDGKKIPIIK